MPHLKTVAISLLLSLIARDATVAAGPATTQATTQPADEQKQLQAWWDDLAKPEPYSTKALLDFSSKPDATVAFLKENLKPLKLEQSELDDLVKALGSDDEKVWKPAFDKMQYFDPRLTEDIGALLEATTDQTARNRLIEIFSDKPADELKGATVNLRRNGQYFIFYTMNQNGGGSRSWYVEPKVAKLDMDNGQSRKKLWQRADRAIVLLQHIGTPGAVAILKEMATGNPEAQPTRIAKLAVDSLGE